MICVWYYLFGIFILLFGLKLLKLFSRTHLALRCGNVQQAQYSRRSKANHTWRTIITI